MLATCITVNVMGIDYLLIQPPSVENSINGNSQWEVTPIRQNMGKKSSIQPGYQKFPTEISVKESYYYSLIESMTTTLRELNEELPFTTILKFTDNEQHVWISQR